MKTKIIAIINDFIPANDVHKEIMQLFIDAEKFDSILEFYEWFADKRINEDYLPLLAVSYNSERNITVANRVHPERILVKFREEILYETEHKISKKEMSALRMIKNRMDDIKMLYDHSFTEDTKRYFQQQTAELQSMQYCIQVGYCTIKDIYFKVQPKPKVRAYNTSKKTYV